MRKYASWLVPAILLLLLSPGAVPAAEKDSSEKKVVVYYFFTRVRCTSCVKIEQYTGEALKASFPAELKDGRVEWRPVKVDQKGNEHYSRDYQLYTKSVVVSELVNGKEVRWKNLEKVWEMTDYPDAFKGYVRDEVKAYLAGKGGQS